MKFEGQINLVPKTVTTLEFKEPFYLRLQPKLWLYNLSAATWIEVNFYLDKSLKFSLGELSVRMNKENCVLDWSKIILPEAVSPRVNIISFKNILPVKVVMNYRFEIDSVDGSNGYSDFT